MAGGFKTGPWNGSYSYKWINLATRNMIDHMQIADRLIKIYDMENYQVLQDTFQIRSRKSKVLFQFDGMGWIK